MSTYSNACCTIPPIVSKGYVEKGRYQTLDGTKTYVTGPPSARNAILVVFDIFGFFPQTVQGADILAFSDHENKYRVFLPDFFEGKAADISWYPPTTEDHQKALGNFFGGVGNPVKAVERIPALVSAIKTANPNIENVYALGMCWGGKVVTLASNKYSVFRAVAQVHPAMLDPADAKEVKVNMCVLASKDEAADDVSAYESNLTVPHYVETFGDQVHGWMAARADLEDASVSAKYRQGYSTVLDFFAGRLTNQSSPSNSWHQIILWSIDNAEAALKLVDFIQSLPSRASRDDKAYILASKAGATKAPLSGRTSKAQGFNVASILSFKSEDDSVFFVTQDSAHDDMIAVVRNHLIKTPIVSVFGESNSAFQSPRTVGDLEWTGAWE